MWILIQGIPTVSLGLDFYERKWASEQNRVLKRFQQTKQWLTTPFLEIQSLPQSQGPCIGGVGVLRQGSRTIQSPYQPSGKGSLGKQVFWKLHTLASFSLKHQCPFHQTLSHSSLQTIQEVGIIPPSFIDKENRVHRGEEHIARKMQKRAGTEQLASGHILCFSPQCQWFGEGEKMLRVLSDRECKLLLL